MRKQASLTLYIALESLRPHPQGCSLESKQLPPSQSQGHPGGGLGTEEAEKVCGGHSRSPQILWGLGEKSALQTEDPGAEAILWPSCSFAWEMGPEGLPEAPLVRLLQGARTRDQCQLLHQLVYTKLPKPGSVSWQTELQVVSFGSALPSPHGGLFHTW